MKVLKVASRSNPNSAAGAIARVLEQDGVVEIHAIGAGAVNQTVKAVVIAHHLVKKSEDTSIKVISGPGSWSFQLQEMRKQGSGLSSGSNSYPLP